MMVRFDDLLAARIVSKSLPERRLLLLECLADLREGRSKKSLLYTLVTGEILTMEQARSVQDMAERYKHGRRMGIYAHLLEQHGVPAEAVREHRERLGQNANMTELGRALVASDQLTTKDELRLHFEARLAADRDMHSRLEAYVAAHRPSEPQEQQGNLHDSGRFDRVAQLPPVSSAIFRLEMPVPTIEEAEEIVESALGDKETWSSLKPPTFPIPDWVDTSITGTYMIGEYRILGQIDSGGAANVYLGYLIEDADRPVAVKILKPNPGPDAVGRFKREMLANGLFSHPNALEIYEAGKDDDGADFLAMEFFDGRNLETVLAEQERLPPRVALVVARKVLQALEAAHKAGLIHRDIKPANILLSDDHGEARLMDFGIALVQKAGGFEDKIFHTGTGRHLIGTARYMSPEQAQGVSQVDERSDLYSVGLVLYEMLSGRFPYEAEGPLGFLECHISHEPRPLGDVSPDCASLPEVLPRLVGRLLHKTASSRPPDAATVVKAIDRILPRMLGS